jgi:hypothetical protein
MEVQIKFTYSFSDELLYVFKEFSKCKYVNRYSDCSGSKQELMTVLFERKQDSTRMPIMEIFYNGELVGLSFPKKRFTQEEQDDFGIDDTYHKIGAIYILPEFRNKGIAYVACKQFISVYPNICWHVDENNSMSVRLAEKLKLEYSHLLVKPNVNYKVFKSK